VWLSRAAPVHKFIKYWCLGPRHTFAKFQLCSQGCWQTEVVYDGIQLRCAWTRSILCVTQHCSKICALMTACWPAEHLHMANTDKVSSVSAYHHQMLIVQPKYCLIRAAYLPKTMTLHNMNDKKSKHIMAFKNLKTRNFL